MLFESVINRPNVVVCIIGYGFRDPHINRRLADAVTRHELRLVVIVPDMPHRLRDVLYVHPSVGGVLWDAVEHWPYSLVDLFPARRSRQDLTEAALTIYRAVFSDFDSRGR